MIRSTWIDEIARIAVDGRSDDEQLSRIPGSHGLFPRRLRRVGGTARILDRLLWPNPADNHRVRQLHGGRRLWE